MKQVDTSGEDHWPRIRVLSGSGAALVAKDQEGGGQGQGRQQLPGDRGTGGHCRPQ